MSQEEIGTSKEQKVEGLEIKKPQDDIT